MLSFSILVLAAGVWALVFTLLPWAVNQTDKIKLDEDKELKNGTNTISE